MDANIEHVHASGHYFSEFRHCTEIQQPVQGAESCVAAHHYALTGHVGVDQHVIGLKRASIGPYSKGRSGLSHAGTKAGQPGRQGHL